MSYISLISNVDLNPCEAIGASETNLQNVVVILFKFNPALKVYNENINATTSKTKKIKVSENRTELLEISYARPDLLEIMEGFITCYKRLSGLQMETLMFERKLDGNGTCGLSRNRTNFNYSDFTGKTIRIFEYPEYQLNCESSKLWNPVIIGLEKENLPYHLHKLAICGSEAHCKNITEAGFETIFVSENLLFYENWEIAVDKFNSSSSTIFSESDQEESKYLYFLTAPNNSQFSFSSFMAVLIVILFFLSGLFVCCCALAGFALVEEDFQKRNEEREWMAVHLRREEHRDFLYPISPTPSNQDNMATAISNVSRNSESGIETARSSNISISSSSNSSSNVSMDRTQMSETISGTTHTARSKETKLETENESN